jgi:hypothetical protein
MLEPAIRQFDFASPRRTRKAQYATLSYCWGSGVQQLTTITLVLRDHMLALPCGVPKQSQTPSRCVERLGFAIFVSMLFVSCRITTTISWTELPR